MFAHDTVDEFAAFGHALAVTRARGEVAAAGTIVDRPAHCDHGAGVFPVGRCVLYVYVDGE